MRSTGIGKSLTSFYDCFLTVSSVVTQKPNTVSCCVDLSALTQLHQTFLRWHFAYTHEHYWFGKSLFSQLQSSRTMGACRIFFKGGGRQSAWTLFMHRRRQQKFLRFFPNVTQFKGKCFGARENWRGSYLCGIIMQRHHYKIQGRQLPGCPRPPSAPMSRTAVEFSLILNGLASINSCSYALF